MRQRLRPAAVGCVVLMFVLAPAVARAASVTLANGDVVEGTIQGRVLMKRGTPDGTPAFRLVEGKDITRIDAAGIESEGQSVMLMGMRPATVPDVLQALVWWDEGRALVTDKALVRKTRNGEVIGVRVPNDRVKPAVEELAGTYRIDPAGKAIVLIPSIQLQKPDGTQLTIGVAQIVKFTKPSR